MQMFINGHPVSIMPFNESFALFIDGVCHGLFNSEYNAMAHVVQCLDVQVAVA